MLWAWLLRLWDRICPRVSLYDEEQAPTVQLRPWSAEDDCKERELYLANPLAFWLRPDRHEHGVPCWMVEGEWKPQAPLEQSQQAAIYAAYLQSAGGLIMYDPNNARQYQVALQMAYQQQNAYSAQNQTAASGLLGIASGLGNSIFRGLT